MSHWGIKGDIIKRNSPLDQFGDNIELEPMELCNSLGLFQSLLGASRIALGLDIFKGELVGVCGCGGMELFKVLALCH